MLPVYFLSGLDISTVRVAREMDPVWWAVDGLLIQTRAPYPLSRLCVNALCFSVESGIFLSRVSKRSRGLAAVCASAEERSGGDFVPRLVFFHC